MASESLGIDIGIDMDPDERQLLRQQLEALAIEYWHVVDMERGDSAPSYYTDDACFVTSVRAYQGRAAIEAFYRQQRQNREHSARVALHVMSHFRIEPEGDHRVSCRYTLSLFAADGEPVLSSRAAIVVSSVDEVVLKQPDGSWRHLLRQVRPLFRDGSPTRG